MLKLARTPCSGIWYRTLPPPPPPTHPHPRWRLEYVETNCCIPQGYHLVCYCGGSVLYSILDSRTLAKSKLETAI